MAMVDTVDKYIVVCIRNVHVVHFNLPCTATNDVLGHVQYATLVCTRALTLCPSGIPRRYRIPSKQALPARHHVVSSSERR